MNFVLFEVKEIVYNIDTPRDNAEYDKGGNSFEQKRKGRQILREYGCCKQDEIFSPLLGPHAAQQQACGSIVHGHSLPQWATIHTPAMINVKPTIWMSVIVSLRNSHEAIITITYPTLVIMGYATLKFNLVSTKQ